MTDEVPQEPESTRLRDFLERAGSSVLAGVILYWLAVAFGVLRSPASAAVRHGLLKVFVIGIPVALLIAAITRYKKTQERKRGPSARLSWTCDTLCLLAGSYAGYFLIVWK